ncbi:hypothetical protein PIB30_101013 [Stylosanthes scabra]|uniref:Uncharacterized protein n=1 Tax=Stylosanthes scabra TaxID=79078 RepID=A0ABU6SXX2_9FABA|nr:hypothetical protein [Stylosanthes scabra]
MCKRLLEKEHVVSKWGYKMIHLGRRGVYSSSSHIGSYIHEDAQAICERIMDIEQRDESSRLLSQNDSLNWVFGKEHSGRVHVA